MIEITGPVGFAHIESAPRDGSWLRLRFRRREDEETGQWLAHPEMKAGGSWFDRRGCYITPGPLFWAPHTNGHDVVHC
jgi:hypothetical protein